MKLFKREEKEKRNIDDILTPKEESVIGDCEDNAEKDLSEEDLVKKEEIGQVDLTTSALKCFGWEFSKTEKWLIKCVNVWYCIASFAWFLFGAITFAPVIFIRSKLKPVLKDDLKALLVSVAIYAIFVVALIFLLFVGKGEGATEAASSVL